MAVNGVSDFTVENNVGAGQFGGQAPAYNPPAQPFLMNPGRSSGSFSGQPFASAGAFQYLIGIEPALPARSVFAAGALLLTGGTAVKDSGPVVLSMQSDNDLVLYSVGAGGGQSALWSSGTNGSSNTDNAQYPGRNLAFSSAEPYLEILDSKQDVLWTENDAFSAGKLTLKGGQFVQIGSQAGKPYFLTMQTDGNLVMYESAEYSKSVKPLWASNTAGHSCSGTCEASFLGDGNFVLSDGTKPFWETHTDAPGKAGTMFILSGAKPYIKILGAKGAMVWNSSLPAADLERSFVKEGGDGSR
jgi:hypothetical protein